MPFVRRNWKGEITGVWAKSAPDDATEELPGDDAEIIAFLGKFPKHAFEPLSEKDLRKLRESNKRAE